MIGSPLKFVLVNFLIFLVILGIGGFSFAFPTAILMSIFVLVYNYKKLGFIGGLHFSIVYLLVFDSEIFYFSPANIRVWYFYLILIYISSFIIFLKDNNTISIKKENVIEYLCFAVLMIWSLYFLFAEADFLAKVNNLKYWVFYIGLILVFNRFFKQKLVMFDDVIDFIISISNFVCLWGIFQFFTNILGISNFQLDFYNIRPSGFFSETTWYSEFTFFGLMLIFLRVLTNRANLRLLYFTPLYFLGFMLSVTRNTFLACALYLVFSFLLSVIIEKRIYLNIIKSKVLRFFGFVFLLAIAYLMTKLGEVAVFFSGKFSGQDGSAQGRIEAYNLSISRILNGGVFGNGFSWDISQTTESGSALGAKSFNVFLMVAHIFGLLGFLVFLVLIFSYLLKMMFNYYVTKSIYIRYAILIFVIFLQMAMFAPIHQYPFGMLIVSISIFLFRKGLYERNSFCNTTV